MIIADPFLDHSSISDVSDRINHHLIDHYYTSFHHLHPVLAPKDVQDFEHGSSALKLVVQLLGSLYCSTTVNDYWIQGCRSHLPNSEDSGPDVVQANILYCIAFHAFDEHALARKCLAEAFTLARSLGMHQAEYTVSSERSSSVQESLRRTWWELLTVDAMMAARDGQNVVSEDLVNPSMLLPADQSLDTGSAVEAVAPFPHTLKAFRRRMFSEQTVCYSSYAYRIEAVLILRQVIIVAARTHITPDEVQSVNILLASWPHHLPQHLRDFIDAQGQVDYLMLQAHQIIHWGSMLLHFPRSNLFSRLPVQQGGNSCMQGNFNQVPFAPAYHHAIGAVRASKAIADMAALRLTPEDYSPMAICSFAFATMVQIAAGFGHGTACLQQHERRISLLLGLLKSFSPKTKLAAHAEQQVRRAAASLFRPSSSPDFTASQVDELAVLGGWGFDFNCDTWL